MAQSEEAYPISTVCQKPYDWFLVGMLQLSSTTLYLVFHLHTNRPTFRHNICFSLFGPTKIAINWAKSSQIDLTLEYLTF